MAAGGAEGTGTAGGLGLGKTNGSQGLSDGVSFD